MSLKTNPRLSLVEPNNPALAFTGAEDQQANNLIPQGPAWVEVTPLKLTLPHLDPAFDGYRVAQFSDLHVDHWMTPERLDPVIDLVNALGADLIAITGDYITHRAEAYAPGLTPLLKRLSAPDGVLAILGNHDHWAGERSIRSMLRLSGLTTLDNNLVTVQRDGASLHFAGIDDYYVDCDRLDLVLDKMPSQGAAVLLAHEPDFADISSRTGRFDLQISGHTHGGQIDLPVIGRLFLPRHARKYPCGLYRVGGMWLYTNRGLGMSHVHIRYNAKSEITLYTLKSGKFADRANS